MKKIGLVVILLICAFVLGAVVSYRAVHTDEQKTEITSRSVVEQLKDQGFLVTQQLFVQESIQIEKTTGSAVKDFFLGQTVDAQALLAIDMGIDLTRLSTDDVEFFEDRIEIDIPGLEVRTVSLAGPITLNNSQGIVKKLFDNDDGYNEAIALLKEEGRHVLDNAEIEQAANKSAQIQVTQIIHLLVGPDREVVFK